MDDRERLLQKLKELQGQPSTVYPGDNRLVEAWYLTSTFTAISGVLFDVVKQGKSFEEAVDANRNKHYTHARMLQELDDLEISLKKPLW